VDDSGGDGSRVDESATASARFDEWSDAEETAIRSRQVRIGTDVTAISSFERMEPPVAERVRRRVFSQAERDYCAGTDDPPQHYAVRWALKEAFVKLVGGFGGLSYDDITVVSTERGPALQLSRPASRRLRTALDGNAAVDVSLSHDRAADVAVAQVVAVSVEGDA
jgi:holo-[acyl-carrier protein] synthase